jgi:ribosomal protein L37E
LAQNVRGLKLKEKVMFMSDAVHNVQQEFWRPPLSQPTATTNLAEACRRCGTEFMVGAAFCHICGANRHRATVIPSSPTWTKHLLFLRALEFSSVMSWFGLPLPALCAFLVGVALLMVALSMAFISIHDASDFEAVQLWRIQWLMAACAAFLAGILLRSRKPQK